MPLVSVVTAAHGGRAEYLAEAGRSLADQELPAGWELEWIVQEDGPDAEFAEITGEFPFSRHDANGGQLGIAVTRNLALVRARGELVHVLDSDDQLLPRGLAVAIEAFQAYPQIHWVAGQADDLLPGPTRLPYPASIAPGLIDTGSINTFILDHGHTPVLCAGLTLRTATVRALGGWIATPRAEDLALLVAVSELAPGYLPSEVTWLYRRHLGQMTRQAWWATVQYGPSLSLVRERIAAVREVGLRLVPGNVRDPSDH